jgi:hypothetical protein
MDVDIAIIPVAVCVRYKLYTEEFIAMSLFSSEIDQVRMKVTLLTGFVAKQQSQLKV